MIDLKKGILFDEKGRTLAKLGGRYDDLIAVYVDNGLFVKKNPYVNSLISISGIRLTVNNICLGAGIDFNNSSIVSIVFFLDDGTSDSWDGVGHDFIVKQYSILINLFSELVGRLPDFKKRDNQCGWNFSWGRLTIFWEDKSFSCTASLSS